MAGPKQLWWVELDPADGQSQVVFPRAQYLGQFYLISLLMIWMRGLSTPSVSEEMTRNWAGVSICSRVGRLCRGIWTGWIDGPRPVVWSSTRLSAGSCTWVTTIPCNATGLGRVAGKLPSGKGPRGAGWQPAEHEPVVCPGGQEGRWHPGLYQEKCGQQEQGSDCAPLLGTGEAAPGVLCSVLGPSLQERHWGAGVCPNKGNEAGEGSREQVFWGAAEGTGII